MGSSQKKPSNIIFGRGITSDTKLYRYISLSQFLFWSETGLTTLRKLNAWDDPWEQPLRKAAKDHFGPQSKSAKRYEDTFGQCWTVNPESEGMWRIYSSDRQGLRIMTLAHKFQLIEGIRESVLSCVDYARTMGDVFCKAVELGKHMPEGYPNAFIKLFAYEHEQEARLVVRNDEESLLEPQDDTDFILLKLDPAEFIDEMAVDPRAQDWYVQTVCEYCNRLGFSFIPRKSGLYSPNIAETGLQPNSISAENCG